MAKATRAEREMEQILQICALRDELRVVREELDKTRAKLAKADNELNSAAYDLERQGRELADARLDSARVDAWERMNRKGCCPGREYDSDRGFIGWGWKHDTYKTWREAMDAAMKEAK